MRQKANHDHPLESLVLQAFEKSDCHDGPSLAPYLSGSTIVSGAGQRAYLIVAKDVLGFMHDQGKLWKDLQGWYRLADTGPGLDASVSAREVTDAKE